MQSRSMSLVESATNVVVGFVIAVICNLTVLPLFGLRPTFDDAAGIGAVLTGVSLARSYTLRRIFNGFRQ